MVEVFGIQWWRVEGSGCLPLTPGEERARKIVDVNPVSSHSIIRGANNREIRHGIYGYGFVEVFVPGCGKLPRGEQHSKFQGNPSVSTFD